MVRTEFRQHPGLSFIAGVSGLSGRPRRWGGEGALEQGGVRSDLCKLIRRPWLMRMSWRHSRAFCFFKSMACVVLVRAWHCACRLVQCCALPGISMENAILSMKGAFCHTPMHPIMRPESLALLRQIAAESTRLKASLQLGIRRLRVRRRTQ
jgi:hypothetical protein